MDFQKRLHGRAKEISKKITWSRNEQVHRLKPTRPNKKKPYPFPKDVYLSKASAEDEDKRTAGGGREGVGGGGAVREQLGCALGNAERRRLKQENGCRGQ